MWKEYNCVLEYEIKSVTTGILSLLSCYKKCDLAQNFMDIPAWLEWIFTSDK